jgi:hypothetical protein
MAALGSAIMGGGGLFWGGVEQDRRGWLKSRCYGRRWLYLQHVLPDRLNNGFRQVRSTVPRPPGLTGR